MGGAYYKLYASGGEFLSRFKWVVGGEKIRDLVQQSQNPDLVSELMKSRNVRFLKSAVMSKDWPLANRPEILMAGRSNCGKSSIINAIYGKKLAHTSSMPGRTATLNFFDVENDYRLVDSPGYGYAKGMEVKKTGFPAVERLLKFREVLAGLILIMDIRRDWQREEKMLIQYLKHQEIPWALVLNKADKLNQKELSQRKKILTQDSKAEFLFCVSALKKTGLKELESHFFNKWVKPFEMPVLEEEVELEEAWDEGTELEEDVEE
ncbi:MAG: ribosome biogenesis GTP-binding protein YihA/YsxC [Bdellovibrionales bacterium]